MELKNPLVRSFCEECAAAGTPDGKSRSSWLAARPVGLTSPAQFRAVLQRWSLPPPPSHTNVAGAKRSSRNSRFKRARFNRWRERFWMGVRGEETNDFTQRRKLND